MRRLSALVIVTVPGLALFCIPSVAHTQQFAFALGTNVAQGPTLQYQSLSAGFAAQASAGYRLAPRLRVRFDALVSHFRAGQVPVGHVALPTCFQCGGSSSSTTWAPTGPVGVTAVVASEVVDVLPAVDGGVGFYVMAGGGTYYLFQHPTAPALMRVGLSGGAGVELRLEGNSTLFLEARYHGLANAPADARWFVPVTVGMRF